MTHGKKIFFAGLALMASVALRSSSALACPYCGQVTPTFAQQIANSDIAVIARLAAVAKRPESKDGELNIAPQMATFEIVEVLKGTEMLAGAKRIDVVYFNDDPIGTEFLIEGVQPLPITWTVPQALTPHGHKYLSDLMKLPAAIPERLVFMMDYLGDTEEMLATDAYDEFAVAPYSALKVIKDKMPHDHLAAEVQDPNVNATRRRLYLTMLGVCGNKDDLPMLEALLKSKERKFKTGVDATVACYLVLRGQDGLPFVEDLFLKPQTDEYVDIFSVVQALRVLGQDKESPIPLERIVQSMRLVLDHPRVADQAIPDLARWQDWSVMERLVAMFKSSDPEESSWVRVPVINYLRSCPLPKAKEYVAELRKIDPKAVRQSEVMYPIGPIALDVSNPNGTGPAPAPRATALTSGLTKNASMSSASADAQPGDAAKPAAASSSVESRSWFIIIPAAILGALVLAFVARGPRSKAMSKTE